MDSSCGPVWHDVGKHRQQDFAGHCRENSVAAARTGGADNGGLGTACFLLTVRSFTMHGTQLKDLTLGRSLLIPRSSTTDDGCRAGGKPKVGQGAAIYYEGSIAALTGLTGRVGGRAGPDRGWIRGPRSAGRCTFVCNLASLDPLASGAFARASELLVHVCEICFKRAVLSCILVLRCCVGCVKPLKHK